MYICCNGKKKHITPSQKIYFLRFRMRTFSDCHNGSRVLGRLIIKGLTIVKKKSLHGCVHNIGGHTALHFLSGWPAKHNTRAH